jgi:PAS domain S-box-containing protein
MGLFASILGQGGWAGIAAGVFLAGVPAALIVIWLWLRQRQEREQRAHAAIKARRNELIVEASGEGIFELDTEGRVRYANPAAARMSGYGSDELLGLDYRDLVSVAHLENAEPGTKRRFTTDMRRGIGAMLKRKDGRLREVEYKVMPISDPGMSPGALFTFADMSERARLDAMIQDMQATAKIGAWEYWPDNDRLIWTDEVYRIHDLPVGGSIDLKHIIQFYDPVDQATVSAKWRNAIKNGEGYEAELHLVTPKGRSVWVHIIAKTERIAGRTLRMHGIFQDITDRRAAERQLRETRDFFAQTLDAMPLMVTYVNTDGVVTYCNRQTATWWARPREQIVGRPLVELLDSAAYLRLRPHIEAVLDGQPQSFTHVDDVDGARHEWQVQCVPELTAAGRVRGFFWLMHDLSEIKRLEARLAHAQKMEAVGQLTGGIAHDFNNLLGVVIGNLQLLERGLTDQPGQLRKAHTAMRAALRGADLTRRLLAFARRQVLEPEVIDLNAHLRGWDELLHRTLGDSIDVRIVREPELWLTRVDPGQIESAILNLAINARDAMPQGGALTIETSNRHVDEAFCVEHPELQSGDYTCISVNDTGVGIDAETLKSVFEPFFTTKELGSGSGLGLSMVHGFAKQSGGAATIESTVGVGTTVCIYLPRSEASKTTFEDTGVHRIAPRGHETILVVEDDSDLRETSAATLEQLGYRVLQAGTADQALKLLDEHDDIELLFTDIMMPGGMLGPSLAQRARELRPELTVLFTTGYAQAGVLASGGGIAHSDVLAKPFRVEELAMRIRHLLDREVRVA